MQSFRFQAKAYPGYKHARTLGVVKGKGGKESSGWKGEERSARSFVFVRKGEGVVMGKGKGKNARSVSSDDEDEDDGEGEGEGFGSLDESMEGLESGSGDEDGHPEEADSEEEDECDQDSR